jgi:hypothetical protein
VSIFRDISKKYILRVQDPDRRLLTLNFQLASGCATKIAYATNIIIKRLHFNIYLCDYGLLLTLNHQEAAGCTLYRNARAFADGIYMKRWRILMEICVYYILYLIAACCDCQ